MGNGGAGTAIPNEPAIKIISEKAKACARLGSGISCAECAGSDRASEKSSVE